MEFTPHHRMKIQEIINTYNQFEVDGQEESLYADTINIDNKEVIYGLIFYVGAYKSFDYEARAQALEQLTYHLITETLLPIDYKCTKGQLSPLELALLIDSPLLVEAITTRLKEEEKERTMTKKHHYHKKHKR